MEECSHEETFPMPDSLATVCKECGKVWVDGEPWNYKSGHIMEWTIDLVEAQRARQPDPRIMQILEAKKPQFPWATIIPALIGATIGLALIIWGISKVN